MKRRKARSKNAARRRTGAERSGNAATSRDGAAPAPGRREFVGRIRNGLILAGLVGGGGWYIVDSVQAHAREHDLTRIGNGTPAVVQIHDPGCPTCRALQRETRAAMKAFDGHELQFLVANITEPKGRRLANTHGVGHVTLLLFDGDGDRKRVLRGSNGRHYLERMFRRHVTEVAKPRG